MKYPAWRLASTALIILLSVVAVAWVLRDRPPERIIGSLAGTALFMAAFWWYRHRRARGR